MADAEQRLDCLALAVDFAADADSAIEIAGRFAAFVDGAVAYVTDVSNEPEPDEPPARDVDAIGFPLDKTPPDMAADVPDEMRRPSPWTPPGLHALRL